MANKQVIVLSDKAVEIMNTPAAPLPVIEDIYSISDKRAWVVVCTEFAAETKAQEKLEEAKVSTFLPIERSYVRKQIVRTTMVAGMIQRRRTKTVRRPVDRPLLPGYLFAELPAREVIGDRQVRDENEWVERGKWNRLAVDHYAAARVAHIEGVDSLLGAGTGPLPIPSEFVDLLRKEQRLGSFDRTSGKRPDWVKKGAQARIDDGPFASFLGVIEEFLPNDVVKVAVDIFGRATPVTLELAQIIKPC